MKRGRGTFLLGFLMSAGALPLPAQSGRAVEKLLQRGAAAWKAGKALEAMDWFGRALARAPRMEALREAFEKAAGAALDQALAAGARDRARRICREALARLGDHPRFGLSLGRILAAQGRLDAARRILERTARLPGGGPALLELARLLRRQGDLEGGADLLEEAGSRLPARLRGALASWARMWRLDARIRKNKIAGRYSGGPIFLPRSLSHSERRFLTLLAGRALSQAARVTGLPDRERVEVVFSTPEELKALGGPAWAAGLFQDGVVRVLHRPGARRPLERALRHEFGHALLTALSPGLPGWLQEGVAQMAEEKDPARSLAYLRSLPGALLPGAALESGFTWMRDSRLARAAYAESHLVTLYLFQTRPGRRAALYQALSGSAGDPSRALRTWMGRSLDGALRAMARRFRLRPPPRAARPPR